MSTERRQLDGLFDLSAAFVGTAARVGLQITSAPLILLPPGSRQRVRRAMAEVARAVVAVPGELTAVSERVVDDMFSGPPPSLPSPEQIGDRARAFTDRLGRAAEEFGASVGRATNRAADQAERTAAKVDEWVATPPKTPEK